MAILRVNPTRMELSKIKRRLKTAERGHKLLKDKRDEMVRQFIELIRDNRALRKEVEKYLTTAQSNFVLSKAVMGKETVEESLMYPSRRIKLNISSKNIMSVDVPVLTYEEESAGQNPYGFITTTSELDITINSLSEAFSKMIELAQMEKTINLLANEIEKTRRRVNALEYVMIPQLTETIKYIKMKLDESDRANITRLLKMKEMLAEKN